MIICTFLQEYNIENRFFIYLFVNGKILLYYVKMFHISWQIICIKADNKRESKTRKHC